MRKLWVPFLVIFAILGIFSGEVYAGSPWYRFFQDIKLPTQKVIERMAWTNPAAASSTLLQSPTAAASPGPSTFTSFSAQPDFARVIKILPGGTTANVGAGTAVITGTDIYGQPATDSVSIASTQSTASTSVIAFKTVSSVTFPAVTGGGVTVAIGTGSALGISKCSFNPGDYVFSEYGGAYETTRGTFVSDTAIVGKNVFTPNGTLDGAHNVQFFYIQNYACH